MTSNGWLEAALGYAEFGWRVIPLHSGDKRPCLNAWQNVATSDRGVIERWATLYPNANLGVVMGAASGIIDVESDSREQELVLAKLAGSDGPPATCCFESARGKHWLFRWSPDLPCADKAVFYIEGLGFRTGNGGGAQSAFPPSVHHTGKRYRWLVSPDECPPAEISPEMMGRIIAAVAEGVASLDAPGLVRRRSDDYWLKISHGVREGERNSAAASYIGKLLSGAADPFNASWLAVQFELLCSWNERNSPPLPHKELKATFDSILRREQAAWTARRTSQADDQSRDRHPETGVASNAQWRLARLKFTDPPQWRLYSPYWEFRTDGGFIVLDADQVLSGSKIRLAAAAQANVFLDKTFVALWEGTKKEPGGLAKELFARDEVEEGSPDESRELQLAEAMLDMLSRARVKDEPDEHRGEPTRLHDGSVWFKPKYILDDLKFGAEPPTSHQLSRLLRQLKAQDKQFRHSASGRNARYKRLRPESIEKLREMALHGAEPPDGHA
jgi:hypothetical protein